MGFTDRKPWTITEKDVATKWGLAGGKLACYLCGKVAEVGEMFRWLYMNGASPSPGNVMCCSKCDHVGIEDEIRASVVAWEKSFPGCDYEIRPAMKLADLERRLAEARRDSERLTHMIDRSNAGFSWLHERVWEQAAQLCPLDADEAEDVQKWVRAVIDADIAARKEGV